MRVTAQLIDAESGAYLWSEAYDRQLENVLAIQEEMARAIVDTLQLTLAWRGVDIAQRTSNLSATTCVCKGAFMRTSAHRTGCAKASPLFEQAIAADESSADAYAGLADAYSLLIEHGLIHPAEATSKARAAAEKALRSIQGQRRPTYRWHLVRSLFEWDWAGAESLYRRAIALNPGYSRARHWFGTRLPGSTGPLRRSAFVKSARRVIWIRSHPSSSTAAAT